MTAVTIRAGGRAWRLAPADAPPEAARVQVVARARVVDDLTLLAATAALSVSTSHPGLAGRAGSDGLVGLVGAPDRLAPADGIEGLAVAFTVTGAGFAPLDLAGALPAQPGYPDAFAALDLGTRRLLRPPVEIRGRVTRLAAGAVQPVAGATVAVTAAQPVRQLAGAAPPPPPVSALTGLQAVTDADGSYRLPGVARALTLTLTASAGPGSAARAVAPSYADPVILVDFRLP
jgi:hypothetical protein